MKKREFIDTMSKKRIIIIAGHYGSGKTNVAVNLAFRMKSDAPEKSVTLIDLDTVNPYFRAADSAAPLRDAGIRVIIPEYANTNVDLPTLPSEIASVFLTDETVIFDVGGDDGATALGVYEREIKAAGYEMYCVINMYRPLTESPEDTLSDLCEIEEYSRLRFTGIINNSNLGDETTKQTVEASLQYADRTSELAKLPLVYTAVIGDYNVPDCINDPLIMNKYTKMLF